MIGSVAEPCERVAKGNPADVWMQVPGGIPAVAAPEAGAAVILT